MPRVIGHIASAANSACNPAAARSLARSDLGIVLLAGCQAIPECRRRRAGDAARGHVSHAEAQPRSVQAAGPSNDRDWTPEQAKLPLAEFDGNRVTVHNIRDCRWRSVGRLHRIVLRQDVRPGRSFVRSISSSCRSTRRRAWATRCSVSASRTASIWRCRSRSARSAARRSTRSAGFFRQYELIYVVASERDVIQKRVNCDLSDVYLYRSTATPEQARELFVDVMRRVEQIGQVAGVLRHADEQLHDQHPQPRESPEARRGALRLPRAAARLLRRAGLRPGLDRASRIV